LPEGEIEGETGQPIFDVILNYSIYIIAPLGGYYIRNSIIRK